jgi:predicted regulator of amino acid metabolism with ACT domain
MKILAFLDEFAKLSPVQQKIFLFCLQNCPHPRKNSSDINRIAAATGVHRKSVERAFKIIKQYKILRRCVSYIRIDVRKEIQAEYVERLQVGVQSDNE